MKERGFAKLELKFKDYKETNKCLDDDETRKIVFELPGRARTCRGIIVGWDLEATLDELVDAMVDPSNIVSLERLRKRFFNKDTQKTEEKVTQIICATWEGILADRKSVV